MVMTFRSAETFVGSFCALVVKCFLSYCLANCPGVVGVYIWGVPRPTKYGTIAATSTTPSNTGSPTLACLLQGRYAALGRARPALHSM